MATLEPARNRFHNVDGHFDPGFTRVVAVFSRQLAAGEQVGAGLTVYRRGEPVVDIWGGFADPQTRRPWERDTRLVVFSVTKGFVAMALHLLADRGKLDWQAPVAHYWPEFGQAGKEGMTVGTLLGHRGGLATLDVKLTLADCYRPERAAFVRDALERQRPAWTPGEDQGYHALTYGLYASELFRRVAGEELGPFLRRELFAPLDSDVHLGTPASEDARFATLVPPAAAERVGNMVVSAATAPDSAEAGVFKAFLTRGSTVRGAFLNPALPREGVVAYNRAPAIRAELAWGGATGSARGVARAYLPFASGGTHDGRSYLKSQTLAPAYARQGWSERDRVLCKPLGWSNGFLKEERHIFSPNPESFGHAGMGGALGWADPVEELAIGYVMNRMDWRVRSKRTLELTRALYDCEALARPRL